MDIVKFNQELAERVKKAQVCEKANKLIDAIDLWVSIADLVLNVSKSPDLPFSYKSMLVKKSEQIVTHIKMLKSKLIEKTPKKVKLIEESKVLSQDVKNEELIEKKVIQSKPIVENKEIADIPEGFQEIEPSKDFKIITPHDEAFLDKLLNMESHDDINYANHEQVPSRNEGKSFCFACGAEIALNLHVCPQCGTKLD